MSETKNNVKIGNFVGGHDINIYANSMYNPAIRKYVGGNCILTIPYSGKMLSAKKEINISESLRVDGVDIPTSEPQKFKDIDELPEGYDYYIVSAMYVAACQSLGKDTSKLITIGGTVVDGNNHVIGITHLVRN